MELTLKTVELTEMVGKAITCSSNNKLIPLTGLMGISVKENILTLATTDATNYFYVTKPEKLDCEDFDISVMADLFTKLVQKTTSENITLSVNGGILEVKGNGTYKMELPLDENGLPIKFPKKLTSEIIANAGTVKLSSIKNVINANKASLAVNMELPALTCYYCGERVVTSDSYKICSTGIKMFEKALLITPQLMELLGTMTDENINVTIDGTDLIFSTSRDFVYSPVTEGIETFPIEAINSLVDQEFTSMCKIPRSAVVNLIDRLSLFVSPYDKKGIYLTFTQDGVMFSSKKSSGQELIPYTTSENFAPYTCCLDIEMFKSQLATQDEDNIELYYGSEVAVKLVNRNIIEIIALSEDDRVEA